MTTDWGGIISAIGSWVAADQMNDATQSAVNSQTAMSQQGIDAQYRMWAQMRNDFLPYMQAGAQGIAQLSQQVPSYMQRTIAPLYNEYMGYGLSAMPDPNAYTINPITGEYGRQGTLQTNTLGSDPMAPNMNQMGNQGFQGSGQNQSNIQNSIGNYYQPIDPNNPYSGSSSNGVRMPSTSGSSGSNLGTALMAGTVAAKLYPAASSYLSGLGGTAAAGTTAGTATAAGSTTAGAGSTAGTAAGSGAMASGAGLAGAAGLLWGVGEGHLGGLLGIGGSGPDYNIPQEMKDQFAPTARYTEDHDRTGPSVEGHYTPTGARHDGGSWVDAMWLKPENWGLSRAEVYDVFDKYGIFDEQARVGKGNAQNPGVRPEGPAWNPKSNTGSGANSGAGMVRGNLPNGSNPQRPPGVNSTHWALMQAGAMDASGQQIPQSIQSIQGFYGNQPQGQNISNMFGYSPLQTQQYVGGQAATPTQAQLSQGGVLSPTVPNLPGNVDFEFNSDDPVYQWKLDQQQEMMNRQLSQRGLHNSRPGLDVLGDQQMNLISSEGDKQFARQQSERDYSAQSAKDTYGMQSQRGDTLYNRMNQQQNTLYDRMLNNALQYDSRNLDQLLQRYNMGQSAYNNMYNSGMDLTKIGSGAAGSAGQGSISTGQGVANQMGQMGNALAQGSLLSGNTMSNFYSGLGNMFGNQFNQNQQQQPQNSGSYYTPYYNNSPGFGPYGR